jgi:hypothetical protein
LVISPLAGRLMEKLFSYREHRTSNVVLVIDDQGRVVPNFLFRIEAAAALPPVTEITNELGFARIPFLRTGQFTLTHQGNTPAATFSLVTAPAIIVVRVGKSKPKPVADPMPSLGPVEQRAVAKVSHGKMRKALLSNQANLVMHRSPRRTRSM